MRVRIERSSGLAGIVQQFGPIDTELLPPDRARTIEHAIARLAKELANKPPHIGTDIPTYRVTVTDGSTHHTYTWPETKPGVRPDALDDLLTELGT
ncbi:protealysin inhibitor emfourin [Actinopolymorpha sp. B17G11]|uniref:protealysin inhibitor emfourin n=1 Tax=Actinopolymorpha sp. B17G11 TaxID=3160861 RepID=UPI0032E3EB8D